MIFTIFKTNNIKNKYPESPFNDKTFIFENLKVLSNFQAYQILVNNFVLNLTLNIKSPIRVQRLRKNLELLNAEKTDKIIFDFDCDSSEKMNQVIDYFKNINCIIGESRSFNGLNNFNLKGIIRTELLPISDIKNIQAQIQHDLKDFGYYNEDVLRITYFTAPILKSNIILNNENGIILKKNNKKLIDFIPKAQKLNFNIISNNTIDVCLEYFKNLGFIQCDRKIDGSIIFSKDNDNYIWFSDNPYFMFNRNRLKSVNIWEQVKKYELKDFDISEYLDYSGYTLKNNFEINTEIENIIEKFLFKKTGVLTLKSFMGSGKTKFIKHIVEKSKERDFRILIITNRITLAKDFQKRFNLKLYLNKDYEIGDSLICQYDSLFKYDMKNFDLFIMDEFMSLLFHTRNNLTNNIANIAKFFELFDKRLLISDAFLTDYILKLINNKNIFNIINENRDMCNLYEAPDKQTFLSLIYNAARNKQKIAISSTSKNFIVKLQNLLSRFDLKIISLTADNIDQMLGENYDFLELSSIISWDVLIYSPVVSVGVSILDEIKYHFHFDNSKSVDVISSLQMTRRTRKSKNIIYYIEERYEYCCINYNTMREQILQNPKNEQIIFFDINKYGDLNLSKVGQMCLKIDVFNNMLKRNYKQTFKQFLKMNFQNEPVLLKHNDFDYSDLNKF